MEHVTDALEMTMFQLLRDSGNLNKKLVWLDGQKRSTLTDADRLTRIQGQTQYEYMDPKHSRKTGVMGLIDREAELPVTKGEDGGCVGWTALISTSVYFQET